MNKNIIPYGRQSIDNRDIKNVVVNKKIKILLVLFIIMGSFFGILLNFFLILTTYIL